MKDFSYCFFLLNAKLVVVQFLEELWYPALPHRHAGPVGLEGVDDEPEQEQQRQPGQERPGEPLVPARSTRRGPALPAGAAAACRAAWPGLAIGPGGSPRII